MRQRWLSILLAFFLLFGQAAVVVHALDHLQAHQQTNPCAVPADVEQCGPGHDVCPQCLALAALAVAAPAISAWLLAGCPRRWHFPPGASCYPKLAFLPAVRSRGPPLSIGMPR